MMIYPYPPHRASDPNKVGAMVTALLAGERLPPVVVEPGGWTAISGSHRLAAWRAAGMMPETLELTHAEVLSACEYLGVDHLREATDLEEVCRAVWRTTPNRDIRSALADQV